MKLIGIVWNGLSTHERLTLLRHCKTVTAELIREIESKLDWDKLWPVTQDDLTDIDASAILGRDLEPR